MTGTILAVADSDSYLKYAVHFLERLPGWRRQVMVVRSPVEPTSVQTRAALAGTFLQGRPPAVLPLKRLVVNANPAPDVVLVAATGPVAREVLLQWATAPHRPALVTALPGVSMPATRRALEFRELSDLFLVHSIAEAGAFAAIGAARTPDPVVDTDPDGPAESIEAADPETDGVPDAAGKAGASPAAGAGPAPAEPEAEDVVPELRAPELAVARLPMLLHDALPHPDTEPISRIVFAAQAKMPFEHDERASILLRLAATARARPDVEVVVKLRARHGEPQTHLERYPYDVLWSELRRTGAVRGDELDWADGPLAPLLGAGTALVTVSSTAAVEAMDRGLRVGVLSDFGVSHELLNELFLGSGVLTTLDAVERLELTTVASAWGSDNYFHDDEAVQRSAWPSAQEAMSALAERARAGDLGLDAEIMARARTRAWRHRLRTRLPAPVLHAARRVRSMTG